ncbi:hypothetical protein PICSAR18_02361 [Mycobacterium avium subsp. paratuberculosis]|nr:hypothetical protein PICSAR18_02361 [Mycobacterium avium subsp. paratuberculosis]
MGRMTNPTANVANANSVPTKELSFGKNTLLKTSPAAVAYRKKSYHSTVVPSRLAATTMRSRRRCCSADSSTGWPSASPAGAGAGKVAAMAVSAPRPPRTASSPPDATDDWGAPQPHPLQQRQHALAEPVGLFQMRIPRQDEVGDAQFGVFGQPLGDLGVRADQGGARSPAHQADPGPQVRADKQFAAVAAVQLPHPALALGLAARQAGLHPLDVGRVDRRQQPVGLGPRRVRGVAADHVNPQAVLQDSPRVDGQPADPVQLLGDRGQRFAPGEIDVGVLGGHRSGRRRGAAEEHRGYRVGRVVQLRALDPDVFSRKGDRLWRGPQLPHHVQEFGGARVPRLLVQEVAVGALLVRFAAGDHVQQQPSLRVPLEGAGHLRGQRRAQQPGTERDQKLQRLGRFDQHRRRQPRVLTPQSRRREDGLEAVVLGGRADLVQVPQRGRPVTGHRRAVPARDQVPRIAVGRQKPVKRQTQFTILFVARSPPVHRGSILVAVPPAGQG